MLLSAIFLPEIHYYFRARTFAPDISISKAHDCFSPVANQLKLIDMR